MTATEGAVPILLGSAHLVSGPTPYLQAIKVGDHDVLCDEPVSRGGADLGPPPFGLLLAALAGCTSITLRMYADRKGWDLGPIRVDLKFFRGGDSDRIERTLRFGRELTGEQAARILDIAEKTPVTKVLKAGLRIATHME